MTMDVAGYYAHLTSQYRHYGGTAHGWHYGIWEPGVETHDDALRRSNELLLRGLDITPSTRILDVGFGEGGFAVWAATQYGASVTGITICRDHVALARRLAAQSGVTSRCRFLVMHMEQLAFEADHFDVVVNQETACYARNKGAYLAEVRRVLKPGGVWRSLDFSIQGGTLPARAERHYRDVCDGFHIPSLAPLSSIVELGAGAGLDMLDARDLTTAVLPTAATIRRQCYLPLVARTLRLDWTLYSRDPSRRRNRRGHVLAAHRYSRGLERGVFRYTYCAARKPLHAPTPVAGTTGRTAVR